MYQGSIFFLFPLFFKKINCINVYRGILAAIGISQVINDVEYLFMYTIYMRVFFLKCVHMRERVCVCVCVGMSEHEGQINLHYLQELVLFFYHVSPED